MLTKYRAHRVAELDALLLFQDQSEWQKTTFLPTKFLQTHVDERYDGKE